MSGAIAAIAQWGSALLILAKMVGIGYLIVKILDWVNTLRSISFFLDSLLLKIITRIYEYFEMLVKGEMFDADTIAAFSSRIMLFIGILIFFKLAVKMVNYAINPDSVWDENKGLHKLVQRVMFGMILIVLMPTIFSIARGLQKAVIEDHVIEYIFSGKKLGESDASNQMYTSGQEIGFTVWEGFASVNGLASTSQKKVFENAQKYKDVDMLSKDMITEKAGEEYIIDYFPILSTIALAYIAFSILVMALNVVMRTLELSVMQIISPIIIVDYVADNNSQTFGKWVKASCSSYLSIFIEIAIMSFIVFILQYLNNPDAGTLLASNNDVLLKAIIVIGLFLFCKKIPDLISKIFGIELDKSASAFLKSLPKQTMNAFNRGKRLLSTPKRIGEGAKNLAGKGLNAGRGLGRTFNGIKAGVQNSRDKGFMTKVARGAIGGLNAAASSKAAKVYDELTAATSKYNTDGASASTFKDAVNEIQLSDQERQARIKGKEKEKEASALLNKVTDQATKLRKDEISKKEPEIEAKKNQIIAAHQGQGKTITEQEARTMAENEVVGSVSKFMDKAAETTGVIYQSKEYAEQVSRVSKAKDIRNETQSIYEKAVKQIETTGIVTLGGVEYKGQDAIQKVDDLRIDFVKASSQYDFANEDLGRLGAIYPNDSNTRTLYEQAKNRLDKNTSIDESTNSYGSFTVNSSSGNKQVNSIKIDENIPTVTADVAVKTNDGVIIGNNFEGTDVVDLSTLKRINTTSNEPNRVDIEPVVPTIRVERNNDEFEGQTREEVVAQVNLNDGLKTKSEIAIQNVSKNIEPIINNSNTILNSYNELSSKYESINSTIENRVKDIELVKSQISSLSGSEKLEGENELNKLETDLNNLREKSLLANMELESSLTNLSGEINRLKSELETTTNEEQINAINSQLKVLMDAYEKGTK